ncbi:uncharacterized protein LOC103707879 isoform X5 [Phoenix dactylifera]|uniref:Uncharacterized protein LOC103707879 isoform X5 n=1 Tax=Phoenix dactylifera TaxID=42345 RepID=A0A8B9ATS8_PHODC|nr:uncharacterized protein LOC103707879 isoform X5 [Phoenix dactylifera]XP_038990211.1 uncharacterized protein LOC103707879 isoform X5 [Phoenix dactylifera]
MDRRLSLSNIRLSIFDPLFSWMATKIQKYLNPILWLGLDCHSKYFRNLNFNSFVNKTWKTWSLTTKGNSQNRPPERKKKKERRKEKEEKRGGREEKEMEHKEASDDPKQNSLNVETEASIPLSQSYALQDEENPDISRKGEGADALAMFSKNKQASVSTIEKPEDKKTSKDGKIILDLMEAIRATERKQAEADAYIFAEEKRKLKGHRQCPMQWGVGLINNPTMTKADQIHVLDTTIKRLYELAKLAVGRTCAGI